MTAMDSMRYTKAVADVVTQGIDQAGLTIASTAEQSGIARTTLMRRLDHPESSPLNVIELAQLAQVLDMKLSAIIKEAEALAARKQD